MSVIAICSNLQQDFSCASFLHEVEHVINLDSRSTFDTVPPSRLMLMMMMMDELTLTWHIVLRLQRHVTVKKESHNSRRVS